MEFANKKKTIQHSSVVLRLINPPKLLLIILKKGSRIFIEGELKISKNESDGVTYTNVDVLVRNFELIDFREKEEEKPKQAPAKKTNSRKELPF